MARKGGSFQHTCDLLNRYLKEKGTLSMSLSLDPNPKGEPETPPRTMNLLPGLEDPSPSAHMTIFYGGKVMVFENFPAESAREIMAMAGRLRPLAAAAPDIPVSSDLPIARRASLNRFLEKRKNRISSRAPYQAPASSSSSSAASSLSAMRKEEVRQPWLGLAQLSPSDLPEVL